MSPEKITKSAKATEVNRNWFIVDADGQTLGRLASQVASILRGKHCIILYNSLTTWITCVPYIFFLKVRHW